MESVSHTIQKLKWNLPWLVNYPFSRIKSLLGSNVFEKKHVVFVIANHFEPSWREVGHNDVETQIKRLLEYQKVITKSFKSIVGSDGVNLTHTNFYPIEQYDARILDTLAEIQSEGLGETEFHLHHGLEKPDTAENLRRMLNESRDIFSEKHKLLSRFDGKGGAKYAFVHGNLALGNSGGGENCGVDEEMQILADTGCYADFTLPSAPVQTQVPVINKIYECGLPLNEAIPHSKGNAIRVNQGEMKLPIIFQGPLVFNWTRKINGIPVPRLDDGALVENQFSDLKRFKRLVSSNVTVEGKSDWVFVKLYCHGFFDHDQNACIGDGLKRFFSEILEESGKSGKFSVHFASAREAFNMVSAAVDGKNGSPNEYRNYLLRTIMDEN
jgi:hypothetical protein